MRIDTTLCAADNALTWEKLLNTSTLIEHQLNFSVNFCNGMPFNFIYKTSEKLKNSLKYIFLTFFYYRIVWYYYGRAKIPTKWVWIESSFENGHHEKGICGWDYFYATHCNTWFIVSFIFFYKFKQRDYLIFLCGALDKYIILL